MFDYLVLIENDITEMDEKKPFSAEEQKAAFVFVSGMQSRVKEEGFLPYDLFPSLLRDVGTKKRKRVVCEKTCLTTIYALQEIIEQTLRLKLSEQQTWSPIPPVFNSIRTIAGLFACSLVKRARGTKKFLKEVADAPLLMPLECEEDKARAWAGSILSDTGILELSAERCVTKCVSGAVAILILEHREGNMNAFEECFREKTPMLLRNANSPVNVAISLTTPCSPSDIKKVLCDLDSGGPSPYPGDGLAMFLIFRLSNGAAFWYIISKSKRKEKFDKKRALYLHRFIKQMQKHAATMKTSCGSNSASASRFYSSLANIEVTYCERSL